MSNSSRRTARADVSWIVISARPPSAPTGHWTSPPVTAFAVSTPPPPVRAHPTLLAAYPAYRVLKAGHTRVPSRLHGWRDVERRLVQLRMQPH